MQPCRRCTSRGVATECRFLCGRPVVRGYQEPSLNIDNPDVADDVNGSLDLMSQIERQQSNSSDTDGQNPVLDQSPSTSIPQTSRLIQDAKGKYMFIGDSANLSFLQSIRRVVNDSIGPCSFVEDPLRYQMVEASPEGQPSWLNASSRRPPPPLTLAEATYLIRRYMLATNCVFDLFDESDLLAHLGPWLENESEGAKGLSSTYYLIFAIGAQTCPEDKEELADAFFNYGRYLAAASFMEDPSISTVQSCAMITMYMLGASRRNAAFMYLGTAVRAAYALGLHRKDISALFTPTEFRTRERLWKAIRILDLFMSASLGRPPSTSETRDTRTSENYSASADLCAIFETILTEIYSKRMISTEALEKISEHHRQWTASFQQGLTVDGIQPTDVLDGGRWPNIGLLHIKEAYYWTIMLLTRPFLLEVVSLYISPAHLKPRDDVETCTSSCSAKVLVHACVDSAIRTIELLRILLDYDDVPKRLPFVVNSIFVSALVLGLAHFGDLYKTIPLDTSLNMAYRLLGHFPHDTLARRNMAIIGYLLRACDTYREKQKKLDMDRHGQLVGGVFGQVHQQQMAGTKAADSASNSFQISTTAASRPALNRTGNGLPPAIPQSHHRLVTPPFDMMFQDQIQDNRFALTRTESEQEGRRGMNDQFMVTTTVVEAVDELMLAMSPRTLWFDSYDENVPLFSTIDASTM